MLTAMVRRPSDAVSFVLRGVAGSLGIVGLLRLSWLEAHVVLPATRIQGAMAARLLGAPALPVEATLACSGADAFALCLGAILAYPVPWRRRLTGAIGSTVLILCINIVRIGTLGRLAASPAWFDVTHVFLWPAALTLAITGYVFIWMRRADRRPEPHDATDSRRNAIGTAAVVVRPQPSRRFMLFAGLFLLLFVAASPLYLASPDIAAVAGFIAQAAATALGAIGVPAHAAANVLWTSHGGFLVTQECVSTPLVPIYLAAVCAYASTWRRLIVGVAATLPLFVTLGIARLLVIALPAALTTSPVFLVHAFYQLLLGAVLVYLAARWRHGATRAIGPTCVGILVGVLFLQIPGPFYTRAVAFVAGAPLNDPQEALAFLPAFQVGLYLALWIAAFIAVGWKRFVIGLAALELAQAAVLLALPIVTAYSGLTAHVRDIRGWAVAGPVLILAAVVHDRRTHR